MLEVKLILNMTKLGVLSFSISKMVAARPREDRTTFPAPFLWPHSPSVLMSPLSILVCLFRLWGKTNQGGHVTLNETTESWMETSAVFILWGVGNTQRIYSGVTGQANDVHL